MNTKSQPGEFDAFETAKPDEPIFVLQGGDPDAAPCVRHWAGLARLRADCLAETHGEEHSEVIELRLRATSAENVSWDMDAYRKGHPATSDDSTAYEQSRDSGGAMVASGSTESLRSLVRHRARVRHAAALNDGVSKVAEAITFFREQGWEAEALRLEALQVELQDLADHVQPHRVLGKGVL